ncbi:MAG: UDP-N-acetylmuramoyl-L-alanine--D-glutamate ligase [Nanopusillaceae archaeon]
MVSLVLGVGIAGQAVARLRQAQGIPVVVQDEQAGPGQQQRAAALEGIPCVLGQPFHLLPQTREVIVSPGIPWQHPFLEQARGLGIPVWGEAEVAWQVLGQVPWIGVTGTNGKTTTTALLAAMLRTAGLDAPACGNIGLPLAAVAREVVLGRRPDWIVAELSSYQIEASGRIQPRIGVWTTLTPDHLERHGSLERYSQIKAGLLHQSQAAVLNGDDAYLWEQRQLWPEAFWVKRDRAEKVVAWITGSRLCRTGYADLELGDFGLRLPGEHNLQNLLLATWAATLAGIPDEAIQRTIEQFQGVPHRLETVKYGRGIRWINDSKATNYEAAWVGLQAVAGPVVLIAGGRAKIGRDQEWLELIRQKVARVILIGEAGEMLARRLAEVGYGAVDRVESLVEAVPLAYNHAQRLAPCTVLFSPACASFDQYANFEQRGDHFRACCYALDG